MGHSDISVTANIYTHKNNIVLHSGIEKIGCEKQKASQTVENQRLRGLFTLARPKGLEPSTLRTGI